MESNSVLKHLIENACPSIKYRIKNEIIKENITDQEKIEYYQLIGKSPIVNKVMASQTESGYFSNRFHTPVSNSKIWSHEACVRYLLEMGLDLSFQPLKKAFDALLLEDWKKECTGKAADLFGVESIRASLFVQADLNDYPFVENEINNALAGFRYLDEAKRLSDLIIPYKDKQIFVEGKYLPNIYHLRILAFSKKWRTPKNIELISSALKKLYQWLPIRPTYIKYKSQLVAPAGTIAFAFNKDLDQIDPRLAFWWFTFYELIARMGVLTEDSPFRKHIEHLISSVMSSEGFFLDRFDKKSFINWSGYSGMALEDDWKTNQKRINDLTFRVYLIQSLIDKNYN